MSEKENILTPEQIATIAASAATAALSNKTAEGVAATLKINDKIKVKQVRQQEYANKIKYEMANDKNCVKIVIPEIFKKYQPKFTACVNGCTVTIPADGKEYIVHKDFALIIIKRMRRISANVERMSTPNLGEYRDY